MKKLKNMKNTWTSTWYLLTWDWSTLVLFELMYKLISLAAIPLMQDAFSYALSLSGLAFLTNQNFFQLFHNGKSIFIIIFLIILIVFYIYIELNAILLYFKKGEEQEKVTPFQLFFLSFKKSFILLKPKNCFILFFLLLIPITGVMITSGPLASLRIPDFIISFIHENSSLNLLYYGLLVFLYLLLLSGIFVIPAIILDGNSFIKGFQKSFHLWKKRIWRIIGKAFLIFGMLGIVILFVSAFAIAMLLLIVKYAVPIEIAESTFWYYFSFLSSIGRFLLPILLSTSILAFITTIYYQYQGRTLITKEKKKSTFPNIGVFLYRFVWVFVLFALYLGLTSSGVGSRIFEFHHIDVVAHRAGGLYATENTLNGLKVAIDSKSDYAEIDIQETKDGVLVVLHDPDLKRLSGIDKKIEEMNYEELVTYPVGFTYQNEELIADRIPTLEEMIVAAKGKVKLMIELKKGHHSKEYVKKVLDLLKKYEVEDESVIISLNYSLLEEVKRQNPDMKTGYVMAIAYGRLEEMEAADLFSIEATFVTRSLVNRLHQLNKPVYVWTVDKESDMRKYMNLNVDGIVTDNSYLLQYINENRMFSFSLDYIVKEVLGIETSDEF